MRPGVTTETRMRFDAMTVVARPEPGRGITGSWPVHGNFDDLVLRELLFVVDEPELHWIQPNPLGCAAVEADPATHTVSP